MNNRKRRSDVVKEMVRIAKGLAPQVPVELRGLQWEINRNGLENFALARYNQSPGKFHRGTGKFVSAWLINDVDVAVQKVAITDLPVRGEKAIKQAVKRLLEQNRIPKTITDF